MTMRRLGWALTPDAFHTHLRNKAASIFRDMMATFSTEHIHFLIERGIALPDLVPQFLQPAMGTHLSQYLDILVFSDDEFLSIATEIRPDLADVLATEDGRKWFLRSFRPHI